MPDGKKLLLVEDDLETKKLYQEVLEEAGYLVTTAIDGELGLAKIQEGGFDLILLDIMMPKLDGLAVLTQLQTSPALKPNGPIVVVTNIANDPIVNKALLIGAKAYMIKADLNPDQLVEKVKEFLMEG